MVSPLTKKQENAIIRLSKALDNCHNVGLCGGVFSANFVVWRNNHNPFDDGVKFFDNTHEVPTDMYLDGGAGV